MSAFTEAELIQIRTYVGYPTFKTHDTAFEGRLDLMSQDADRKAAILAQVAKIVAVEAQLDDLHSIVAFKSAENEILLDDNRMRNIRSAGRRECQKLASMIGVYVERDVFSAGWSGGAMPLG